MDLEKRLELYKAEYFFQIDMKEKIYTRMAIFSVFITACITANFTMLDELLKLSPKLLAFVTALWVISGLTLIYIIYAFVQISAFKKDFLVNSNLEMEKYRTTLENHFTSNIHPLNPALTSEIYVSEQFNEYLKDQYATCASTFYLNNVDRQEKLTGLANCSYILLGLTLIISIFFITQKLEGKFNESKTSTTTTTTTNKSNKGR
ncbi:hypothetical protein [Acinetobacter venetianus]|uniref:hypothetical protein n=1 Tax=Acinetobacter venetianus TaxID=52133 RepID=UPI003A9059DB